ncbi:Acyl-CoA N-acyltransferase [Phytophthora cactorum]|nr:Acyl-CoA N-acyltransferase [Phytophthora cactorum]
MTTETSTIIKVRQYRPEDHGQVTKIYVEGLMAADPNPKYRYLWEELLRKDLTNDLADIEGSHMAPGGNFLVAVATKDGSNMVVGIIGLMARFGRCRTDPTRVCEPELPAHECRPKTDRRTRELGQEERSQERNPDDQRQQREATSILYCARVHKS